MIVPIGIMLSMILFFFMDNFVRGWKRVAISPFWIFSYFFALSYPIRYLLIYFNMPIQAPRVPDEESLFHSLMFSYIFWLSAFLSYVIQLKCFNVSTTQRETSLVYMGGNQYLVNVLVVTLILISFFYYLNLFQGTGFKFVRFYQGNAQNEARVGGGLDFIAGELYEIALVIYLFCNRKKSTLFFLFVFTCASLLAVASTIFLATRRPLYIVLYFLMVYVFLSKKENSSIRVVLAFFPIAFSLLAPIGQIVRYSLMVVIESGMPQLGWMEVFTAIGSTFEGVEHFARMLEKIDVRQLIFGVDYGVSYFFKIGLSLVPRVVWTSKPFVYGSVAQQDFLWSMGYGVSTFPSGIMVDSLYGFGAIGFVFYVLSVVLLLGWVERSFVMDMHANPMRLAIAAYVYVYMFNFVRGGTSILQGVLVLAVWLAIARMLSLLSCKIRPKGRGSF